MKSKQKQHYEIAKEATDLLERQHKSITAFHIVQALNELGYLRKLPKKRGKVLDAIHAIRGMN